MLRATVLSRRSLTAHTFVLRVSREGLVFEPGQHIKLGVQGGDLREYSIYSSPVDEYLEVLIREIPEGAVSTQLRTASEGSHVFVFGPFGEFVTPEDRADHRHLFIGNGTGIAPYHSILTTYPDLDYRLVHGVRTARHRYEATHYDPRRYVGCLSREPGGAFHGRVTAYLRETPVDPAIRCYLCGSCDMIYEAFEILEGYGITREQVKVETYY
jgi:ferredoxin--NADP+ reductase